MFTGNTNIGNKADYNGNRVLSGFEPYLICARHSVLIYMTWWHKLSLFLIFSCPLRHCTAASRRNLKGIQRWHLNKKVIFSHSTPVTCQPSDLYRPLNTQNSFLPENMRHWTYVVVTLGQRRRSTFKQNRLYVCWIKALSFLKENHFDFQSFRFWLVRLF